MPVLAAAVRAQGAYVDDAEPWPDHDWSVPTDAETLRHRPRRAVSDQSRYGHAKTDPPRCGLDGRPLGVTR